MGGGRGGRDRVLPSQCHRDGRRADAARDEHNLEAVGASLGKGEADNQEMDGVLGEESRVWEAEGTRSCLTSVIRWPFFGIAPARNCQ